MATGVAVLDKTQYVMINTGKNPLILQSLRDEVRIVMFATQPAIDTPAAHILDGGDPPLHIFGVDPDVDVWAWSPTDTARLVITEITRASVRTTDGNNDNTSLSRYLHRHTGVSSTLAVATSAAGTDYTIEVAVGGGVLFSIGDSIQISNGFFEPTHPIVLGAAGDVLTLDRRIDKGHDIGTTVEIVDREMATGVGTLAAPIEYVLAPDGNEVVHLQRMLISMVHGTAGDMATFGNLPPLINGVIVRIRLNGVYQTLTAWKTNEELKDDMFDIVFDGRASGGGSYGTSGRWTFERYGVTLRLDGATNDQIEIYVQDDLTGLDHFSIKVQGHPEI